MRGLHIYVGYTTCRKSASPRIRKLTREDSNDPDFRVQLRSKTNGRGKNVHVVTWDDLAKFSINNFCERYQRKAPLASLPKQWLAHERKVLSLYGNDGLCT